MSFSTLRLYIAVIVYFSLSFFFSFFTGVLRKYFPKRGYKSNYSLGNRTHVHLHVITVKCVCLQTQWRVEMLQCSGLTRSKNFQLSNQCLQLCLGCTFSSAMITEAVVCLICRSSSTVPRGSNLPIDLNERQQYLSFYFSDDNIFFNCLVIDRVPALSARPICNNRILHLKQNYQVLCILKTLSWEPC